MPYTRALCLALLSVLASSGSAEGVYIIDKKGCKIANPNPKPNEAVTWSGPCVQGFAQGEGVMQWYLDNQPTARYEGTLDHGAVSGAGKLTMPDGTKYEGQWKDGHPDGEGSMTDVTGETVKGRWKEGVYVGPGQGK